MRDILWGAGIVEIAAAIVMILFIVARIGNR